MKTFLIKQRADTQPFIGIENPNGNYTITLPRGGEINVSVDETQTEQLHQKIKKEQQDATQKWERIEKIARELANDLIERSGSAQDVADAEKKFVQKTGQTAPENWRQAFYEHGMDFPLVDFIIKKIKRPNPEKVTRRIMGLIGFSFGKKESALQTAGRTPQKYYQELVNLGSGRSQKACTSRGYCYMIK